MRSTLLQYSSTVYDTNCVIAICFPIYLQHSDGTTVIVDEGDAAQLARDLTDFLRTNGKSILTLRAAYDEVDAELLATIVNRRVSDPGLRAEVGLRRDEPFPEHMKLRLARKLRREVRKLPGKVWFHIDDVFVPDRNRVRLLRQLITQLLTRVPEVTKRPSGVDLSLVLYSGYAGLPLVSNDRDITRFRSELRKRGYARLIVPLSETAT